jgi:ribosome-associated protein
VATGIIMTEDYKSRTQKKKEDRALQTLGEQLVGLSSQQLDRIGLPNQLLEAVRFAATIRQHGAKRRQMQHIGALMRHIDPAPIRKALESIRRGDAAEGPAFQNPKS